MKRNRTLAIMLPAVALLLVLVVYQYGYLRVEEEVASIKEEQMIKLKTLEKYVALIAERPQVEQRLAELKETRKTAESKFISGQTPALAAATLQETVKGIVTSSGGSTSSERVGKGEDLGKFKLISVSVDAGLPDTRALSDILYSLETRAPYLVVKELDSRVRNYREPRDLMVKLDVLALYGGK